MLRPKSRRQAGRKAGAAHGRPAAKPTTSSSPKSGGSAPPKQHAPAKKPDRACPTGTDAKTCRQIAQAVESSSPRPATAAPAQAQCPTGVSKATCEELQAPPQSTPPSEEASAPTTCPAGLTPEQCAEAARAVEAQR